MQAIILSLGVDAAQYDAFVQRVGRPPGCYERKCWWLKRLEKEFGAEIADQVLGVLFG
jgi:hypothetical protein